MTISIGERAVTTRRPQDLDARLLAATGCSALEVQRGLQGSPTAGAVATALMPFLTGDVPALSELAAEIATAGTAEVAIQVSTLYAAVPLSDAAPGAKTDGE